MIINLTLDLTPSLQEICEIKEQVNSTRKQPAKNQNAGLL